MKKPIGSDLLATLIKLLADQEGVKIEYELEGDDDETQTETNKRTAQDA